MLRQRGRRSGHCGAGEELAGETELEVWARIIDEDVEQEVELEGKTMVDAAAAELEDDSVVCEVDTGIVLLEVEEAAKELDVMLDVTTVADEEVEQLLVLIIELDDRTELVEWTEVLLVATELVVG